MRCFCLLLAMVFCAPLGAQTLLVRHATVLDLPAPSIALDLRADLGETATAALGAGIVLVFQAQWELPDGRTLTQPLTLSYSPLLDQYALQLGSRPPQRFDLRNALLAALENANLSWPDAEPCASVCAGRLRVVLDRSRLPAPLRLNAVAARGWQLDSAWTTVDK